MFSLSSEEEKKQWDRPWHSRIKVTPLPWKIYKKKGRETTHH